MEPANKFFREMRAAFDTKLVQFTVVATVSSVLTVLLMWALAAIDLRRLESRPRTPSRPENVKLEDLVSAQMVTLSFLTFAWEAGGADQRVAVEELDKVLHQSIVFMWTDCESYQRIIRHVNLSKNS